MVYNPLRTAPEPPKTPIENALDIALSTKIFRLRLKDKHDVREVFISARDFSRASTVGENYCAKNGYRFIRVESMVVAGEEML